MVPANPGEFLRSQSIARPIKQRGIPSMNAADLGNGNQEPLQIPIEGELDLHTFHPRDFKTLIPAYLEACEAKGIRQVRLIHGKGIGNLRRTVHAILSRLPEVTSFSLASEPFGGWGATIVTLRRKKDRPHETGG